MALKPKDNPNSPRAIEGEILPPEASSTNSGRASSADHIADAAAEIIEPGPEPEQSADTAAAGDAAGGLAGGGDASGGEPVPPKDALPFDAWYEELWKGGHIEIGEFTGLQSPGVWVQRPMSKHAAKAFYRTCCRVRWLNFLLIPGTTWKGDAVIIALYTVPLMMAIRAEVGWKMAQEQATAAAESGTAGEGEGEA